MRACEWYEFQNDQTQSPKEKKSFTKSEWLTCQKIFSHFITSVSGLLRSVAAMTTEMSSSPDHEATAGRSSSPLKHEESTLHDHVESADGNKLTGWRAISVACTIGGTVPTCLLFIMFPYHFWTVRSPFVRMRQLFTLFGIVVPLRSRMWVTAIGICLYEWLDVWFYNYLLQNHCFVPLSYEKAEYFSWPIDMPPPCPLESSSSTILLYGTMGAEWMRLILAILALHMLTTRGMPLRYDVWIAVSMFGRPFLAFVFALIHVHVPSIDVHVSSVTSILLTLLNVILIVTTPFLSMVPFVLMIAGMILSS